MAVALPPVVKPIPVAALYRYADAGLREVQKNAGLKGVGAWWVTTRCRSVTNNPDREGQCGFGFVFMYGTKPVCGGWIDIRRVPKQPKVIEYKFREVNCK